MNIKPAIYEKLTVQERILATLEAEAREDEEEVTRLVKTCPKQRYLATDLAYSNKMQAIYGVALVVESDIRGHALNFLMQLYMEDHLDNEKHQELHRRLENATCSIQAIISIKKAWHEVLEEEGIDPALIEEIFKPTRHFIMGWVEAVAIKLNIAPEPGTVESYKEPLGKYLDNVSL